jgi:hypothetical protein
MKKLTLEEKVDVILGYFKYDSFKWETRPKDEDLAQTVDDIKIFQEQTDSNVDACNDSISDLNSDVEKLTNIINITKENTDAILYKLSPDS